MGGGLTVPEGDDEFEQRRAMLAASNSVVDLREEINGIVGLDRDTRSVSDAAYFRKKELAALVLALGGPQGGDDA